jgi:tRNA pseudouridine65 synthase
VTAGIEQADGGVSAIRCMTHGKRRGGDTHLLTLHRKRLDDLLRHDACFRRETRLRYASQPPSTPSPSPRVRPPPRPATLPELVVLHRDEDLLVVAKPSGVAMHRGAAVEHDTVAARLAEHEPGAHAVHRLDRGTSGALVVARHPEAARALSGCFERGAIAKGYLALARGRLTDEEHRVDHPIPDDEGGPRVTACTRLRGLETVTIDDSPLRERRYTWLEAWPETGRFHQVRRHAKHLGHPLLGDANYGRSDHNRFVRDRFGLARLALHAASVTLPPWGSRTAALTVHAPMPDDLKHALARMGFDEAGLQGRSALATSPEASSHATGR